MVAVSNVLYPRTPTGKFDMSYYISTHMPLVFERFSPFGLLSWEVFEYSADAAYSVQAVLRWESEDGAKRAFADKEAATAVFGDVPNFSSEKPEVLWGVVKGSQ